MAKTASTKKATSPSKPTLILVTGIRSAAEWNESSKSFDTSSGMVFGSHTSFGSEDFQNALAQAGAVAIVGKNSGDAQSKTIQSLAKNASTKVLTLPVSKTKPNVVKRIGQFLSKLLGLVESDGVESGIGVISESDAKQLLNEDSRHIFEQNTNRIFNWLILNGLTPKNHTVGQGNNSKYSYAKAIIDSCKSRLDWFLIAPLKNFSISNFRQGNSSNYRLIFTILCFFSLVLLPILSFDFGATWDEPEDRKYFEEVISYFQTGGDDQRALDTDRKLHDHLVNYGPFVNLACAFAEEYISPFDTYETRHIVLSLFAFVGLLFTALLARKIGTWRTAVIVMLIMLFTPAFWGHAANNQKDMPFMAFYIASLFYIIRFVQDLPKVRVKSLVMAGLTMGILFSIRAGGLIVFAYLVMFTGLAYLAALKKGSKPNIVRYAGVGLIPLAIAYFIGVIFWPAALQDPFGHPLEALRNFEKFSLVHIYEVFEGQRYYMKDYPWYYGPKMMAITLPLFVLVGFAVAIVAGVKKWKGFKTYHLFVVTFALIFPIVYIIYKESSLYNSWRHILFVMPSVLIIAGVGWDWLVQLSNKIIRWVSGLGLAGLMVWVGIWMFQNHPYQYMYYNELVGGVKGAFGKYELDYWCQTPKEAIKWIHDNVELGEGQTNIISNNEIISLQYYSDRFQENGQELREELLKLEKLNAEIDRLNFYKKENLISESEHKQDVDALVAERTEVQKKVNALRKVNILWSREQSWNRTDWDYAIWTNRTLSPTQIEKGYFPPKGTIHTIKVDGVDVAAIVKREKKNIAQANDLITQRNYAEAERLLREYIEYDPLEEEAYRTLGYLKLIQGDWDAAVELCNKSIEICPESYFSHNFIGVAYYRKAIGVNDAAEREQLLNQAEEHFKTCSKYKPNFSSAYDGQGDIAYIRGQRQRAIKMYETALQYVGANAQIMYKMGKVYFELNDVNKAAGYYDAAIRASANYAPPYQGMAEVYQKVGQPDKAQEYLLKFQQLGGGF